MDHPFDTPDMEASLAATLAVLRQSAALTKPNEAMVELAERVGGPAGAFAHTLGSYASGPDFEPFEVTADPANEGDDWTDQLQEAGCDLEHCLMIGTTGGGTEYLFLANDDDAQGGYALYLWDMEGETYRASGAPVWKVGTFGKLFGYLKNRTPDLDPRFAALASEDDG